MRRANYIGILLLIGVLSAVSSSYPGSIGTLTAESVTAHLTGGAQRAWNSRWVPVLGPKGPQCVEGEIWTFSRDGKGVKRTCENGMIRDREFTWAFVGTEDDQPVLKIDETRYVAVLRQEKATGEGASPVLVTILRTLRTTQAEPLDEITLTFRGM